MTLLELAQRYSCDKLHSHSYIDVYTSLFRQRKVTRLLEIGIGFRELMLPFVPEYVHGASLLMWQEFFPDAEIFACDIREDTLINSGRIHSIVADQSTPDGLSRLIQFCNGSWDVVIDDGSHVIDHQIFTALQLFPTMPQGSVYCIEDVQEPERLGRELVQLLCSNTSAALSIHRFNKRPDDCLVVIRK